MAGMVPVLTQRLATTLPLSFEFHSVSRWRDPTGLSSWNESKPYPGIRTSSSLVQAFRSIWMQ